MKRKVAQRVGIRLTTGEIEQIGRMIRGGQTTFIKKLKNSKTVHKLSFKDKEFYVIYSKVSKIPISACVDEFKERQ